MQHVQTSKQLFAKLHCQSKLHLVQCRLSCYLVHSLSMSRCTSTKTFVICSCDDHGAVWCPRDQYNGFNPVTGQEYRPPAPHAHHIPIVAPANADHDPLLQYGNSHADRSTIMTWKQPRPSPAQADGVQQRDVHTEHIQDMRKGRIKTEGLVHLKSTSVGDLI